MKQRPRENNEPRQRDINVHPLVAVKVSVTMAAAHSQRKMVNGSSEQLPGTTE